MCLNCQDTVSAVQSKMANDDLRKWWEETVFGTIIISPCQLQLFPKRIKRKSLRCLKVNENVLKISAALCKRTIIFSVQFDESRKFHS